MYRLPMSKYKNASAKIVKKEQIVSGISTNRLSNTIGSLIACNLTHVTFALDSGTSGGSICSLRQEDLARKLTFSGDQFCVQHAHTGPITDLQYSPFNQHILASTGFDSQINLWSTTPPPGAEITHEINARLAPLASLQLQENRCDCVLWNPNVDSVLVSTSLNTVYLWDISLQRPVCHVKTHSEAIQGISWKRDGSLLVTTAKDKTMQIFDPRNKNTSENMRIENSKTANKDSKVVWLGTSDCILSSVYTQSFQREIHLWDIRNPVQPVNEFQIDTGNNVLNPLYDYDTSALFLVGKAETTVRYCEIFLGNDSSAWNFTCNSSQPVDDQIKGVCLVPKFGLDLMKCELDRLMLLTRNSVYPLPYFVPRRSYYDFHADIYPETHNVFETGLNKSEWLEGHNADVPKCELNPQVQSKMLNLSINEPSSSSSSSSSISASSKTEPVTAQKEILVVEKPAPAPARVLPSSIKAANSNGEAKKNGQSSYSNGSSSPSEDKENNARIQTAAAQKNGEHHSVSGNSSNSSVENKPTVVFRSQPAQSNVSSTPAPSAHSHTPASVDNRKTKVKSVYYQSKFKYIDGKSAPKPEAITNLRNLSTMWPSECNGFQVNTKFAAYLISGSSGQLGLVSLSRPGRLPDTSLASIVNRSKVSDFQFDPFDEATLAVACDDGTVKVWHLPDEGLTESLELPHLELRGHQERLYCIRYHPYVSGVLATASYDRTVRVWNVDEARAERILRGHTDAVFGMSWSPDGFKLATICKDGFVRVYDVLNSDKPIAEEKCGPAPNSKAARIEWVLNGKALLVSGFGRGNLRQIYLFDSESLAHLQTEDINQSPSLLIPYYDPDINVLYMYAKGEETLYLYEILEEEPYFQVLTPYKAEGLHFALAFLPKVYCDIKAAEIARAYRLTKDNRIERMSFSVPRVKLGYFQDDIYPDTIDRLKPYLSASEWFAGAKFQFNYISLQPENMERLTEIQAVEQAQQPPKPAVKKPIKQLSDTDPQSIYDPKNLSTDERKIINSMLHRATLFYKPKSDDEDDNGDWN